ncbi:glycosyltransferase [Kluyvera ascorbata]
MKIAFYHNDDLGLNHITLMSNASSGTVLAMLNLARGLSLLGHHVVILSKAASGLIDNIEYVFIDDDDLCLQWYKENDVDVFISVGHAHTIIDYINNIKKTKIYHWHHNYLDIKHVISHLKNKNIDGVVCVSPHHLSSLYKYGLHPGMTYIRNPLDFNFLKKAVKDENGKRSGLAYVGNVSLAKGFTEAVNVYNLYVKKGGGELFHIYGSTNLYVDKTSDIDISIFQKDFQIIIHELYNRGLLVFHGKIPREILYSELQKRKLLLCGLNKVGAAESAGMGMIEAQFFGCEVVTYNRGGQKDSVYNKNNIIKISESISDRIIEILSKDANPDIAEVFFDRYSIGNISSEWISLFSGKTKNKKHIDAFLARINSILCK